MKPAASVACRVAAAVRATGVGITRIVLARRALAPISGPVVEAMAVFSWVQFALPVRSVAILLARLLVAALPSIAGSLTLAQPCSGARPAVEAGHAFARVYITVCPCD